MKPELEYLKTVLGVESLILPERTKTFSREEPASAISTPLVFLLKRGWGNAEQALSQKMIAALNLKEAPVIGYSDEEWPSAKHLVLFDSESAMGREEDEQVIWRLGPMSQLMTGSPGEIQSAKREVWNLLKALKEEVEG